MAVKKIKSAAELGKLIDSYIRRVDAQDLDSLSPLQIELPSDFRFCDFAGIGVEALESFAARPERFPGFAEKLQRLRAYREDFFCRLALDKRYSTLAMLSLKQAKNGGYREKAEQTGEPAQLEISLRGCEQPFN